MTNYHNITKSEFISKDNPLIYLMGVALLYLYAGLVDIVEIDESDNNQISHFHHLLKYLLSCLDIDQSISRHLSSSR